MSIYFWKMLKDYTIYCFCQIVFCKKTLKNQSVLKGRGNCSTLSSLLRPLIELNSLINVKLPTQTNNWISLLFLIAQFNIHGHNLQSTMSFILSVNKFVKWDSYVLELRIDCYLKFVQHNLQWMRNYQLSV